MKLIGYEDGYATFEVGAYVVRIPAEKATTEALESIEVAAKAMTNNEFLHGITFTRSPNYIYEASQPRH